MNKKILLLQDNTNQSTWNLKSLPLDADCDKISVVKIAQKNLTIIARVADISYNIIYCIYNYILYIIGDFSWTLEKSSFGVNFCGLLDEFLVNVCGHLIVRKRVTLYQAITKSNPNCNHLMIFFGRGCEFWRCFGKIDKFRLSYSALLSRNCHLLDRCEYPSAKS